MGKPVGLSKLIRLRIGLPYVRRADRARDRGAWIDAVVDYRRGHEWMPWREDLKIQVGNCLKEYGDYEGAVAAYRSVTTGPSRFEAQQQMLDVNRRAGRVILPYFVTQTPDKQDAATDGDAAAPDLRITPAMLPNRLRIDLNEPRRWLGTLGQQALVPRRVRGGNFAAVTLDQVGSIVMERDGVREAVLAGVVAVRGRILAMTRVDTVTVHLGDADDAPVIATVPVTEVESAATLRLHAFNAWIDAGRLPPGRHWLSVRAGRKVQPAGLYVNVADAAGLAEALPNSNVIVPSPAGPAADVERSVIDAPAQIRAAARPFLADPVREMLVIRADQLGDVSASLPAFARLRALFPDARITALVQPAVAAMIAASGVADRVETISLPYDERTERRRLDEAEEARVRAALADTRFDLAVDLCTGDETRGLLLLSEATHLVGFNPDRFSYLDFGIGVRSRDKGNQQERLSHAAMVLTLVEALAVAMAPARAAVPRQTPSAPWLEAHGLVAQRYVVLHCGARHALNRWPAEKFLALAARLLAETSHDLVVFDADAEALARLPGATGRVHVMGLLDPDAFDAIVSEARLLVGNDSGPKHLAAARGVPTVSVHVDRLNWTEWGQDGRGAIVSKRIPCTGCGLNDLALCARDAVCLRSIRVDEVFEAARPWL